MGDLSTAGKNAAADAVTITYASLHSGDPGASGTSNEISGGSPAYARKAVTLGSASGGVRQMTSADALFDVPACTVAYVGFWSAISGTYQGCKAVTSEVFASQGQYKLLAASTSLTIS